MRLRLRAMAAVIAAAIILGACTPRYVGGERPSPSSSSIVSGSVPEPQAPPLPTFSQVDDPHAYIVDAIKFPLPQPLAFLHPAADTSVSGARYYLTGISDPTLPLLLNGEPIENRGKHGSFALSVMLTEGDNPFTLEQGSESASVTIHLGTTDSDIPQTDRITKMAPAEDYAAPAGEAYTLQCVAPAGASISARFNGETIPLHQNAVAQPGVPATFSAEITLPETDGILDLGPVVYQMDGTETPSEGKLFAIAEGSKLVVQIHNVSSSVFSRPSVNSAILTTGKPGATDEVVDYGGDATSGKMYQLRMGGWIQAAAASPVPGTDSTDNKIAQTEFAADGRRERFTLHGTSRPFYLASQDNETLTFRFCNTAWSGKLDIPDSALFSSAAVSQEEADALLTLTLQDPSDLWGYLVEYDGNDTILTCIRRPVLSGGDTPLKGITVALDAGHGGSDTGTLGLPYDAAPMEKDVAIVTAQAVQKYLGLLGATVVMVRQDDENPTMNERMLRAQHAWCDFYLSLHGNGAGYSNDMIAAKGLEVYYFEPIAQDLAQKICDAVSEATGRVNRGAHHSNYRVTMQTAAPAILVELGFLPNPEDFDSLCDPEDIYRTAQAIGDTLVAFLTPPDEA